MNIYLQNNPLWKDELIVHGKYCLTIGREGCLICCIGTVIGINPKELNCIMIKEKVYRTDIIENYSSVIEYMAGHDTLSIYDLIDWNKFEKVFGVKISRNNNLSRYVLIGVMRTISDNIHGRKMLMTIERFSIIEKQSNNQFISADTHEGERSVKNLNEFHDFLEIKWK
jgi:hypothetical protein